MQRHRWTDPLNFFINSTHPRDGADIICDRDERRSGEIFFRNSISSVFRIHLPKAIDIVKT